MDALTHAIEAYVSTAANPITDACAIKAIELISANLRLAVRDGSDMAARENMAYAQFLAGMAFNNASLGFVHAMAHQLGGLYDLPHGVCNAVLLPHVQSFNASVSAARLSDVGRALGVDNKHASPKRAPRRPSRRSAACPRTSISPAGLRELGAKLQDIPLLATNALKDACGLTNPRRADQRQIEEIFRSAF
jgi:alcohol dehydrogenase